MHPAKESAGVNPGAGRQRSARYNQLGPEKLICPHALAKPAGSVSVCPGNERIRWQFHLMIVPCSRYFVNQERPFLDKLNSNFSLLSSPTLIGDPGSFLFSFVRIRILDAGFRPRPLFCSGGISCRLPSVYLPLFRSRAIPWRCPFLCRLCRRHEMPPLQLHNDPGFPLKTCGNDRRRGGGMRGFAPARRGEECLRGFAPARRGPFVSAKGPKPLAPGGGKSAGRMRCGPYLDSPRPQLGFGTGAQPRPQAAMRWRQKLAHSCTSRTWFTK